MHKRFVVVFLFLIVSPALLRAAPEVSFADLAAGRAAIVDDPAYFDRLQPMEMEAETGRPLESTTLAAQRAECRRRYQLAVEEFSTEEREALTDAAAQVDRLVRNDYPRYANLPWNFLKVGGYLEGGFPHTRGKHIILPEPICRWIVDHARGNPPRRPLYTIELLLHEQMHVFQRANAEWFDSLYIGQWGFVRAKSIKSCGWILQHQLVNPDAIDCPWVFPIRHGDQTRYVWPLCSLADGPGPKRMQTDFVMLAFDLMPDGGGYRVRQSPDGRPKYSDLLSVRAYREAFAPSTNIYHPHEIAADLFAKLVLYDNYRARWLDSGQRAAKEKTFGPLRDWFRKNLAKTK